MNCQKYKNKKNATMREIPKGVPAGSAYLATHIYGEAQIWTFLGPDKEHFYICGQTGVLKLGVMETLGFGLSLANHANIVLSAKVTSSATANQTMPTEKDKLFPDMVGVEGGTFLLGDKVECTISDFSIGKYQVTFEEYDRYCEAMKIEKPGGEDWGRGSRPVINVSWFDAVSYCNWLSEEAGLYPAYSIKDENVDLIPDSKGFRLPSEAEWEFAARGGNQSKGYQYSGSNDLDEVGWYGDNSDSKTHLVGGKKANGLGLYDMSGNVWEWCYDWYGDFPKYPVKDYQGPKEGSSRVLRGGAWIIDSNYCTVSRRINYYPWDRDNYRGFRLAQDK
jgi:formylglycine-generating enzyme required for sulfatase activity